MGMGAVSLVGIDTRVICRELLHLVEAVIDRIELFHVAEMPFAGKVSLVTVVLVELGDGRRVRVQPVRVAGNHHNGERGANRDATGHEGSTARRAACLAVPTGKDRPFLCETINIRRGMPEGRAAVVNTVVPQPTSSLISMTTFGFF